jgi:carbon-monoxide dehydrogenase small subunit
VLLDGWAIKSCTLFAIQADGHEVTTIEGLAGDDDPLHPLQEAFWQEHGLQCGYCTPGIIMAACQLLARRGGRDRLNEQEIREAISGNLCRCTGYTNVVRAIAAAAAAAQAAPRTA